MRTLLLIPVVAAAILASGCGHKGEIHDFGAELRTAASDISDGIDENPFADGSVKAYKDVMTKHKSLFDEWTKLRAAKLSAAEKDELLTVVVDCHGEVRTAANKHLARQHEDPVFGNAVGWIQKDFESHFDPSEIH
jgi:hypothetical protein